MGKKGYKIQKKLADIPEEVIFIVVGTVGCFIVGCILYCLPSHLRFHVQGGGTIQSLVAVASGDVIPWRVVPLKLLVTCLYLGSGGGPLGGEGPTIQITTAIIGQIGWAIGIRAVQTQSLLATLGFSCGFAASFNAPLSGILFAAEEMDHLSGRLAKSLILMLLAASVMSTLVVRAFMTNSHLFEAHLPQGIFDAVRGGSLEYVLGSHMWMLIAVPIGILCAILSKLMCQFLRGTHHFMRRYGHRVPLPLLYGLQGTLVASIGAAVFRTTGQRGVWGIGVGSFQAGLTEDWALSSYAALSAGKLLAFVLAVSIRAPGDMLEPVLIGGGCFGGMIGKLLPAEIIGVDPTQTCMILGMSGLFASSFGFPLTPIVITLELTGVETYALVLPVGLCGLTAMTVSEWLEGALLHEIMEQDGIDLHELAHHAASVHLSSPSAEEADLDAVLPGAGNAMLSYPKGPNASDVERPGSQTSQRSAGRRAERDFKRLVKPVVTSFSEFARQITPTSPHSPGSRRKGMNSAGSKSEDLRTASMGMSVDTAVEAFLRQISVQSDSQQAMHEYIKGSPRIKVTDPECEPLSPKLGPDSPSQTRSRGGARASGDGARKSPSTLAAFVGGRSQLRIGVPYDSSDDGEQV